MKFHHAFMTLAILMLNVTGFAAQVDTQFSHNSYHDYAALNNDLANQGQPTYSGITLDYGLEAHLSNVNALTDGTLYGNLKYGNTQNSLISPTNNTRVTITLNSSLNPWGYSLSRIRTITAFNGDRISQVYDVSYSIVGNDDFIPLYSSNLQLGLGQIGSSLVTATPNAGHSFMAENVDQIRFDIYRWLQPGVRWMDGVYREFDIEGVATTTAPSSTVPVPLAFFAAGICFTGLMIRKCGAMVIAPA